DLVVGEVARSVLDQALLVGQLEVHSSPLGPSRRSSQLRRLPWRRHAPLDLLCDALDRDALLLERVTIAQRHGPVLKALVVDGQAERRADLVLAAVALADR